MKYAALSALLLASAAAAESQPESAQKYLQIAEGFIMGTLDAEGFSDIEKCIQDGEAIIKDVESAYHHFEKKDLSDIIAGVHDVADTINEIGEAMKDCSDIKADWEKMIKMAYIFKNPVSFAWHVGGDIIHNGVKITKEIHSAVDDYKEEKWYDFGKNAGEAAAHVFLGQESKQFQKKEKLAKIYQGFLKPFGGKFDVLALLMCVQNEDQALLALDVAYMAFEKALHDTDWQNQLGDALGACLGVYTAYDKFEAGLPACENIWTPSEFDPKPLEKAMSFVSDPFHNLPAMAVNLASHKADFQDDLRSALFHYQMEDYEKFGEFLGNLIKAVSEQDVKAEQNNLFLY